MQFGKEINQICMCEIFKCRDVTINHKPVENRFKDVTIQIGWDAKQITIKLGVGVYMNVWGELTVFRKV